MNRLTTCGKTYKLGLFLLVLTLPFLAFGQVLTTASISGNVVSQNDEPLAGANIMAKHNPSGIIFGSISRDDGNFNIPNLRVGGPYTLTVNYIGYKPEVVEDIMLSLGQNLQLNLQLVEEALQMAGIDVIADARSASTGQSATISTAQIDAMPNVNRGIYDMTRLAANVNGNEIAGKHPNYNTVKIDGAVLNDVFGLADNGLPGGQAGTQPVSLDAIEEIQVMVAPFDVRHSGFAGGALNAVTRSGSNQLEGSVYTSMRNEAFIGAFEEADGTVNEYPEFSEKVYGARLGGALIPDKLHYFVSAELSQSITPNTISLDTSSAQAFAGSAAEVQRVDSILTNVYGATTGGSKQFDAETPSTKILAKIDYNINDRHRLSLRHNFISAKDDINARSPYNFYFSKAGYIFNHKQNSTMLHLYSSLSKNLSNTFTLGYTTIRDFRESEDSGSPTFIVYGAGNTRIYGGAEQYSLGNKLDQNIFQLSNNLSYYTGDHAFSVGTHNEFYFMSNGFFRNYNGTYWFDSVADLEQGNIATYELTYSAVDGDPQPMAEWKANIYGFHAQDIWDVNDQLRLTAGVRFDIPVFPDTPLANDSVAKYFGDQDIKTDQMPSGNVHFSPRLGFNYRLLDKNETLLRGGIGIFSGSPKFVWLSNNFSMSGVLLKTIYDSGADAILTDLDDQYDHYLDPDLGYQKSEIDVVDVDLMFPRVLRTNLAVEHNLPFNLKAGIEFLYSKNLSEVTYKQLNAVKDLTMADGRDHYAKYGVSSNFLEVMYVTNTAKGYQYSLTGSLSGNWKTALGATRASLAYTYSQSKDINSLTSSQAKSNWRYSPIGLNTNNPGLTSSLYELPHRLILSLNQAIELLPGAPTTVSLFYEGKSGSPYSYIYASSYDYNGDGSKDNDLIFVYDDETEVNIVDVNNVDAWDAWEEFVANDEFLSEYKGKIFERNAAREPWNNRIDLRISQKIASPVGRNFELTVDILNFANLLNNEWGQVEYMPFGTYQLLKYKSFAGGTAAGIPTFQFDDPESVLSTSDFESRWQVLVGFRFNF
ncbi:MAG: TonB-dependent receptor [Candidatus Neomarinimicrobiota bacterium]